MEVLKNQFKKKIRKKIKMSRCEFKKDDGKRCKLKTSSDFCHHHSKLNDCSICYNKISNNKIKTFSCGHSFHESCIDDWFERDNKCPMCRAETQHASFRVAISNNPLLININSRTMLEKLQELEYRGLFKGNKLAVDVLYPETAGVFNYHTKELLGSFKIS